MTLQGYNYEFPAIKGLQAGREYYATMCPLRLLPKIFLFAEEEVPPELRAQRTLNKARIPDIAKYVVDNPKSYVFSAITASIDGNVKFEPIKPKGTLSNVGKLIIPMTAKFLINDGQHRRAAIEEAIKHRPELSDETISVVFFLDQDLKRTQQMFSDLNKHAVRPTKSLGILYDYRDPIAVLSLKVANNVPYFKGFTEVEKTTLSNRSVKLFTLSSIYQATKTLLKLSGKKPKITKSHEKLAIDFWTAVGDNIPDWKHAIQKKVSTSELRREYIHAHGIALQAIAIACTDIVAENPKGWKTILKGLRTIDWSRSNSIWDGRAIVAGRVTKAINNVTLTANVIKKALKQNLTKEQESSENQLLRSSTSMEKALT